MKKKKWSVLCAIALTGCLISGGYILHYRQNQKHAEELYEEAKKTAEQSDKTETTEKETTPTPAEATETPVPTPTEVPVDIPIDFASLQKENEDIYAWIKIDGTNIDYPIVQSSTDDTFYIHRGIDKEDLYAGAIYTEMQNAKDFSDPNTVLYGHNMKDGSMFATLHNFRDRDFFDQHREIIIYTPKHILHYTVFAAYTYDDLIKEEVEKKEVYIILTSLGKKEMLKLNGPTL